MRVLHRILPLLFATIAWSTLQAQSPVADATTETSSYRDLVLKNVQSNFSKLRECFQEATDRKDDSIPTKLTTLFRIGKFGSVQSVEFEEQAQMSTELNRCIVGRISYFEFPSRPEESAEASKVVRLILNFEPVKSNPQSLAK